MTTTLLKLSAIRCDSGTQSRLRINEEVVDNYADRLTAGDEFPPMDVFFDGSEYHLADGFHRYMAAHRIGLKEFECVIHKGTATDALWFAIGANRANGERMTPADKRNAITIALSKFPEKTQQEIAGHVGCSQQYVAKIQGELTTSSKLNLPATRKGKDGKTRKTSYAKRGKPINPAPDEPEEPTQDERSDADEVTQAEIQTAGGTDSDPSRPVFHPRLDAIISAVEAAAFDLQAFQDGTEQFTPGAAEDVADALRTAAAAIISEGKRMKKLEAAND